MTGPEQIPTLTPDDGKVIELVLGQCSDWTRRNFEAALTHLAYAHRLVDMDPGMAVFRAITAEEEAATGLMRALKALGYPGAEQLRLHDHVHKAAVAPFLDAIVKLKSELKFLGIDDIRIGIRQGSDGKRLTVAATLTGEESVCLRPDPPLNFRFREGREEAVPDYRRHMQQAVGATGYSRIREQLQRRANERNLVLYATANGLRQLDRVPEGYLQRQKVLVLAIFKAALLIWPYDEIQPFVEEAISAFVGLTGKLGRETASQEVAEALSGGAAVSAPGPAPEQPE